MTEEQIVEKLLERREFIHQPTSNADTYLSAEYWQDSSYGCIIGAENGRMASDFGFEGSPEDFVKEMLAYCPIDGWELV